MKRIPNFSNHLILFVLILSLIVPIYFLLKGKTHSLKGFPLDDAWIHLVYGREISRGGYLAYNSGEPATGSTSPIWAYLLGIIHLLF